MRMWCVDCGNVWAKISYPPGHPQGPDPEDFLRPKPKRTATPEPVPCPKCGSRHTHATPLDRELFEKLWTPFHELLHMVEHQPEEIRQGLLYHLEREILGNLDCGHVATMKLSWIRAGSGHYCSFCTREASACWVFEVRDRWLGTSNTVKICAKCAETYSYEGRIDLLQSSSNVKMGLQ